MKSNATCSLFFAISTKDYNDREASKGKVRRAAGAGDITTTQIKDSVITALFPVRHYARTVLLKQLRFSR